MKQILIQQKSKAVLLLFMMFGMLQLTGCRNSDEPTAQETVQGELTSSTWTLQSVTVDGVDQTTMYQGMTLNFTETTYTTTKGGVVWPASGTWSFTDDTATMIKRDDGVVVTVEATDTSLKLTLTWATTTLGTGRVGSTKGLHVFTFKK